MSENQKISEEEDQEKARQFKEELSKFYSSNVRENFKCPIISGKELNLYKLYKEVTNRGGFNAVCETKQWKDVVSTLDLPPSCTSASFTVKNHYNKYLLNYEKAYMKTSLNVNTNNINQSNNNINVSNRTNLVNNNQFNGNFIQNQNQDQTLNQPTREQETKYIRKKINRPDIELNFFFRNPLGKNINMKEKFYNKKIKVISSVVDMKKIELAFESHITTEIYWAINTLLIFSSLVNASIYIENQPYLMESMTNYIYYCVNNISDLSFIINIIKGQEVKEHERLKEKWKFSVHHHSNNISSQSSISSLYNKEKKLNKINIYNNSRLRNFSRSNSGTSSRVNSYHNLSSIGNHNNSLNINNHNNQLHHNNTLLNKGNFNFMDETNHTVSLPSLCKRNKDLKEIDASKAQILINENTENCNMGVKYEEMTEYELYENLISLIQIIRNLSFTTANEASIFKSSKFMKILYLLFIHSNLNDIVSNALDILTNISKHILIHECPYPSLLMYKLFKCLTSPFKEMSDQALECFRKLTLPSGNEEYFEKMPDEFLTEIVNLLISPNNDIRDSALEILYCLSDQSILTKTRLGKTEKCIERLVGLICSNSYDRISKFAACVLSKLAEIPSILTMIMPYEQELFVAASTDESISKVILGIISN